MSDKDFAYSCSVPTDKLSGQNASGIIEYVARAADHHCLVTLWHAYEQRARAPDHVSRREVMTHPRFLSFAALLMKHRPPGDDYRYNLRALDIAIFMYRNAPASFTVGFIDSVFEVLAAP